MTTFSPRVALIGFGEVGGILAQELGAQGARVTAYDRQITPAMIAAAERCGCRLAERLPTALADAELIFPSSPPAIRWRSPSSAPRCCTPANTFSI